MTALKGEKGTAKERFDDLLAHLESPKHIFGYGSDEAVDPKDFSVACSVIKRFRESLDAERDSTMKELRDFVAGKSWIVHGDIEGEFEAHNRQIREILREIDRLSAKPSPALKEKESS